MYEHSTHGWLWFVVNKFSPVLHIKNISHGPSYHFITEAR